MPSRKIKQRLKDGLLTLDELVDLSTTEKRALSISRRHAKTFPNGRSGKGIGKTREGYMQTYGCKLAHRIVMERILGRSLTSGEIVHHRNGIKDDNRPANLEVLSRSEHAKLPIQIPVLESEIHRLKAILDNNRISY